MMNRYILDRNLFVLSHEQAEAFYSVSTNREVPCVCIVDTHDSFPAFTKYIGWYNLCAVRFDDVEVWERVPSFYAIDQKIAKTIAKFVMRFENEPLVITCQGGVSRSAGIAAGIFDFLDDVEQYNETIKAFPAYNCNCAKYMKHALETVAELAAEDMCYYLFNNPTFGDKCRVREKKHPTTHKSYLEADTPIGKIAINYFEDMPGGWDKEYGHYRWQISYAFQEYKEIHRGPFSYKLYPLGKLADMVADIEKEYTLLKGRLCDKIQL